MSKSQKQRKQEADKRIPKYLPGDVTPSGQVIKLVIWSNADNDFIYQT